MLLLFEELLEEEGGERGRKAKEGETEGKGEMGGGGGERYTPKYIKIKRLGMQPHINSNVFLIHNHIIIIIMYSFSSFPFSHVSIVSAHV